jgi:hypothetical protein
MTVTNYDLIKQITDLRMQGLTSEEIGEIVGKSKSQVMGYAARHNLPRKHRTPMTGISRKVGKVAFRKVLSREQLVALDRLAEKWGCETLTEAAVEIIKDVLEEDKCRN